MSEHDHRDQRDFDPPDWAQESWNSVRQEFAHVLLNGTLVWQVTIASIDWGAGISGILPWPTTKFADVHSGGGVVGWRTTSWEASFARFLNIIAGNDDHFISPNEEVMSGILVRAGHPLDAPAR